MFSWARDPSTVNRCLFARGNLPVSLEAAKVIEANHVEKRKRRAKAVDPPLVARGGEHIPAIDRIPPELARGAEIIRGNSRDDGGRAIGVEVEKLGVRPYVGAIVGDVDGNVSHEA